MGRQFVVRERPWEEESGRSCVYVGIIIESTAIAFKDIRHGIWYRGAR